MWMGSRVLALILNGAIATLADMPKHARGVEDKSDPQAPRLHGRRARRLNIELAGQIERLDMRPPRVEIIDHELHHEVVGPFLLIIALEDETAGTEPEDRHFAI